MKQKCVSILEIGKVTMISKNFKKIALGTALVLTTAFSTPAMAGTDFYKKDFRDKDTELVQLAGQRLSIDKLTFVVHGGNSALMGAAYRVAQRLDDEGVPVAFLLAPDRDNIDITMSVSFYTKGGTKYAFMAYDNDKNTMSQNEEGLYRQARKAYNEDFGGYASLDNSVVERPAPTLASR